MFGKFLLQCRALTFIDLNGDGRLVIRGCRKDLGFLGGHYSVPGDQLGHYSSNSLNAKGQGAHIQENHITYNRRETFSNWVKSASSVQWNWYYSVSG